MYMEAAVLISALVLTCWVLLGELLNREALQLLLLYNGEHNPCIYFRGDVKFKERYIWKWCGWAQKKKTLNDGSKFFLSKTFFFLYLCLCLYLAVYLSISIICSVQNQSVVIKKILKKQLYYFCTSRIWQESSIN